MLIDPTGGVGYAFGQVLPSSHMTTIATQQPRALDAVNGGSYTATANLDWNFGTFDLTIVGAAGSLFLFTPDVFTVIATTAASLTSTTVSVIASGNVDVDGDNIVLTATTLLSMPSVAISVGTALGVTDLNSAIVNVYDTLQLRAASTTTFFAGSTVDGSTAIGGGGLAITGGTVSLGAGATLASAGTLNLTGGSFSVAAAVGAVSWAAQVNFSGQVNLNDDVNFGTAVGDTFDFNDGVITFTSSCDVNLQTPVVTSGTGRVRQRFFDETDGTADKTITAQTADHYFIEDGVLTASRSWTISDTGTADGDWMTIYCAENGGAFSISVRDPTPSTIAVIDSSAASGNPRWVKVARVGGTWRVVMRGVPN